MIRKTIYNGYAFSENEHEKRDMNYSIYEELLKKYRILKSHIVPEDEFGKYDLIIKRTAGYHHAIYDVIKNDTTLSDNEILLICDGGRLCFGGSRIGHNRYRVSED